ncbi:Hypothetical predicted protein [Pelobates cultripes]|uniref:Uncharacterized protein n=1 Tax=Pelobates cultripes TaxID=61616 RepID=A0AAD1SW39_PELCU|nr:Hypothetical predicted protein [Pelobates cultripes]
MDEWYAFMDNLSSQTMTFIIKRRQLTLRKLDSEISQIKKDSEKLKTEKDFIEQSYKGEKLEKIENDVVGITQKQNQQDVKDYMTKTAYAKKFSKSNTSNFKKQSYE